MSEPKEYAWHEFPWNKAPAMPRGPHKKLRLYADANIPQLLIQELRNAGLDVESATESGHGSHPDANIVQDAEESGRVILTMDRDFWDDRKHPLQKSPGIIFIDTDQLDKAIQGLATFYVLFARYYPREWWCEMKARVTARGFGIKGRSKEGKVFATEFKLMDDGKLLTRDIR